MERGMRMDGERGMERGMRMDGERSGEEMKGEV